ncbi:PilZ domain-containing protein [Boseongicola aestuarii]|uniref:PilZ domain-containing protein n=1 Tax=Boseongicola aestuarii TaxID=1470561 RepID=A0A238J3D9_9RHOB|nr:PilZ domain-containing protein [Boseongicola aestuarii]SMX24841.1 hypothetical protein BOA8489_02971 [Boseongicola aestuarii]
MPAQMKAFRQTNDDYRPTRRKVCVTVRLFVDGEDVAATLLYISRDGAKLKVPYAVLPGSAVALHLHGANVPALVQWSHDQRVGLRFLDRLERDVLVALEGRDDTDDVFG